VTHISPPGFGGVNIHFIIWRLLINRIFKLYRNITIVFKPTVRYFISFGNWENGIKFETGFGQFNPYFYSEEEKRYLDILKKKRDDYAK